MSKYFLFVNPDGDYEESDGAFEQADFINVSTGASDADKPIVLDAEGHIDASMIDDGDIDHGSIEATSLLDDDHTQYILVDGSRAFTGSQDMGGFVLTGLGQPSNPNDATRKAYVDAVATGLRVKGNVRVATTGNITISSAPVAIDGVTLAADDRVLVKDQTTETENGIYDYNGSGSAMTRSDDFDNSPEGEIWNGSFIPLVLEGTTNADTPWVLSSVGTGAESLHTVGVDDIIFDEFSSPTQLSDGNGIVITANVIGVDLLDSGSGLTFAGVGTDELAIDFASTFTINSASDLAIQASDLASTSNGAGAAIIGVEDSAGNFTNDNIEDVLVELVAMASAAFETFTAGEAITKGDLVYISANDTVSIVDPGNGDNAIGIAENTAALAGTVQVLKDDNLITGVLSGGTAGDKYYWTGTGWASTMPSGSGSRVWLGGVATNATDMIIETVLVKKNR